MTDVIFLMGSSGVGKSSICEGLRNKGFRVAELSAREPRGHIGNPSFFELETSNMKGMKHQELVFTYFKRAISNKLAYINENKPIGEKYVFERGLFDVVGYSFAFSQQWTWHDYTAWVDYQLCYARMFYSELKWEYPKLNLKLVYVPINPEIPYEAIEARPDEKIRNLCDLFLRECNTANYLLNPSSIEDYVENIERIANI